MRDISVSAVIPAFNERRSVAAVAEGVREALSGRVKDFEVIVVDDGSTDETADAARSVKAVLVSHPVNRGYGQALQTGIGAARFDWVLTIDADGSYPPGEIHKLLEFAPTFDLVIGTRTGVHFWGSPHRALLRWIYLRIAGFIIGERVPDANSGLRLVRKSLASQEEGPVECRGYSHSTTMTLSFLSAGRLVKFTPVEYRAREGRSKVRPLRDILRTLQIMAQVLIAYNPLKLFAALAAAFLAASAAFLWEFHRRHGAPWLAAAAVSALSALLCFLTGCILDSIRMQGRRQRENPQ